MGHQVVYVIDVEGCGINGALEPEFQASPAEFQELQHTGSLWDACLGGLDLSVELTGCVSVVWLPIKYARFVQMVSERERVLAWESELRRALPGVRIVRIDEFLLEKWQKIGGEYWFRDVRAVDEFFQWLEKQDLSAWSSI